MKQFNLEEYLKDPSRKVVTRSGRPVIIHCTNYESTEPIIAEVKGYNKSRSYQRNGRYYLYDDSNYDLFFAPEKPKVERFDLKTLHPFDKVLVRNHSTDIWQPNFFGYINDENPKTISCFGFYWDYCIPYNEETKHLVGTSDDCTEYYKWWEE